MLPGFLHSMFRCLGQSQQHQYKNIKSFRQQNGTTTTGSNGGSFSWFIMQPSNKWPAESHPLHSTTRILKFINDSSLSIAEKQRLSLCVGCGGQIHDQVSCRCAELFNQSVINNDLPLALIPAVHPASGPWLGVARGLFEVPGVPAVLGRELYVLREGRQDVL